MEASPNPASSSTSAHALQIAHVLFMDIVAYSQLPMDEQTRLIALLQQIVRGTSEFSQAQKRRQLLRLPTGDGMALVFFGDAEAPARCAIEMSKALREQPDLKLRMGIHTGPVQRMEDINANRNVAGGGINLAQRVMDCGDAGHILVSKSVADVLGQMSHWKGMLHDLGEAQVKHGVKVHLYNLCTDEAGNRELPQKLAAAHRAEVRTKVRKFSLAVAGVVAAVLAIGGYFYFRPSTKLTDKDKVVLADFENKTGDPVFDDTLRTALSVSLEQSPFLNLVSDDKVAETLRLMVRPSGTKLTPPVAREVCQRTGSKAYITGSIAGMGSHYWIGLKATNCRTGDSLAKQQSEAANKDEVLKALSQASAALRSKLGESLPSVQRFEVPIEATTSSLEALKSYSMGVRVAEEKGDASGIPFLKRTIELDPNFPLAYAVLALEYDNLQQPSFALENATKAYELRDRVSEVEKLHIAAIYFHITGELDKEAETYEMWLANYPRSIDAHGNLAVNYNLMGQYDKALAEYQEVLRLDPNVGNFYAGLGLTYLDLDRLDEAKTTFDQALARKMDSAIMRQFIYALAFLREDAVGMKEQLAWASGKPGAEDLLLSMQSDTEAFYGRMNSARDYSRRAVDSAVRSGSKDTAALWQIDAALREAELGNAVLARQGVEEALALSPAPQVKCQAALALARIGDADRAKSLAEELEKGSPTDTLLKLYSLPTISAAIELSKGNSSQALAKLEPAVPYELSPGESFGFLYPAYVRGQAYLAARNGAAAAAEFQKLIDNRGVVVNFVTGALARLEIGRAYAITGDTAKANASYQEFFTLWKDADPNIPILKEARVEYGHLHQ
jgi:eukaryotic-like serine/threonine-protein kinase